MASRHDDRLGGAAAADGEAAILATLVNDPVLLHNS
jgi:hypothetical protein